MMTTRLPAPVTAIYILLTAFILMLAAPARAEINAADQKKLQGIFEELLAQYTETMKAGGTELKAEGKILVETSDFYYAVSLPHISLKRPDGSHTEIGMIAVNVMPGDAPEQWKMTIALPTPIVSYDASGAPVTTTDIGSQNAAGVWHEKFQNFIKLNAQYKDVKITQHDAQSRIMLPDVKIVYNLTQNSQGRWSGPADIMATGVQILSEKEGSAVKMQNLAIKTFVDDYSIDAAVAYQENVSALMESAKDGETAEQPSAAHVLALYNLISDFMTMAWNGFGFRMEMQGFELTQPPVDDQPPVTVKLGNAVFSQEMKGFRTGSVAAGFTFSFSGLSIAPLPTDFNEATPDHVNLDLRITNLPVKELVALGRDTLQMTGENPDAGGMAGLQALMTVPQLLTTAQTAVTLKDTSLGNPHYNLLSNGAMTADVKAVMGVKGSVRTEIEGLERLIGFLKKAAENPDLEAAQKEKIKETLANLSILQMVGQMDKNAAGKDIRVYNLEVNEQGQTLLNGTDLQVLMQTVKKPE